MASDVSTPPYQDLVAAWKSLRSTHDLRVREVACVGAPRTLLQVEIGLAQPHTITIAAGVHGDEPAGPWALYSLVRDGLLDPRFAYRLWPCTNPTGYAAGTRENAEGADINRSFSRGGTTPESRAIVTANRDRRFLLGIDMHEDFEADGFYCYEPVIAGVAPYGGAVLRAIEDAGYALQTFDADFDLGYPADPHEAARLRAIEPGRVLPDVAAENRYFAGLPLSLFLLRRAAERTLTLESPRRAAWADRLAIHRIAVVHAIAEAAAA